MSDESNEYKKAFLELMGYPFPQVKVGEPFYGALFQPTFYPHSGITLLDKGDPVEIGLSIVEGCFNGFYKLNPN